MVVFSVGDAGATTMPLPVAFAHVILTAPNVNDGSPTPTVFVFAGVASEIVFPTIEAVNSWASADAEPAPSAHSAAASPSVILTLLILLDPSFRLSKAASFN